MRYEHILQIYWTKGFFFGGNLFYFDKTFSDVLEYVTGFGRAFWRTLIKRFELTVLSRDHTKLITEYENKDSRLIRVPLNIIFSQINSVNNPVAEVKRFNIIRLYLIKTYRGKSHALGKPVRGQRTWSNAWNSYHTNKLLRTFISETNNQIRSKAREEKINYKVVKKKYASKKKKRKTITKKKISMILIYYEVDEPSKVFTNIFYNTTL